MAKLAHTSESVINIGLIVLNLDTWLREVLLALQLEFQNFGSWLGKVLRAFWSSMFSGQSPLKTPSHPT